MDNAEQEQIKVMKCLAREVFISECIKNSTKDYTLQIERFILPTTVQIMNEIYPMI